MIRELQLAGFGTLIVFLCWGCSGGTPQTNPGTGATAAADSWSRGEAGRWIPDDQLAKVRFANLFPPVDMKSPIEQVWLAGNNLYVTTPRGGGDYRLRKVDGETGIELWSYDLVGGKLYYPPSVYRYPKNLRETNPDELFIIQNDEIYCIDDKNGFDNYRIKRGFPVSTAVTPSQEQIYVGSWNKRMYAISKGQRHEAWSYITDAPITAPAAISDSNVFFGSEDARLYCLNRAAGYQPGNSWDEPTGGKIVAQPLYQGGKVFVGSWDYKVYCFEEFRGFQCWSHPAGAPIKQPIFPFRDTLFAISTDDEEETSKNRLIALERETGSRRWECEGIRRVVAADQFHCYALDRTGLIHAIRMDDGKSSWTLDARGFQHVLTNDAEGGARRDLWGRLYLVSQRGIIQGLRPRN